MWPQAKAMVNSRKVGFPETDFLGRPFSENPVPVHVGDYFRLAR